MILLKQLGGLAKAVIWEMNIIALRGVGLEPFFSFMKHHLFQGTESYTLKIWPCLFDLQRGTEAFQSEPIWKKRSICGQKDLGQRFHFLTVFPTGSVCSSAELGQPSLFCF